MLCGTVSSIVSEAHTHDLSGTSVTGVLAINKCGEIFRRVHWNNRGKNSIVWRCVSRLENTGLFCDARTVLESDPERLTVEAINQVLTDKDEFLATLKGNIAAVLSAEYNDALIEVDRRLEELQDELLKRTAAQAGYEDVAEEIYRLREQKQKLQLERSEWDEFIKRIADMSVFLQEQPTAVGATRPCLLSQCNRPACQGFISPLTGWPLYVFRQTQSGSRSAKKISSREWTGPHSCHELPKSLPKGHLFRYDLAFSMLKPPLIYSITDWRLTQNSGRSWVFFTGRFLLPSQ